MKKKLFLLIAIVAALVCLFAITVSAAEPNYDGETVTLSDGKVCPLWDTEGNALTWYKTANGYGYIKTTDIQFTQGWTGGSAVAGATQYQVSDYSFTVDGTKYTSKSNVVVANMECEIVIDTGNTLNSFAKTFIDSTVLEYVYFPLCTVALNAEVLRNCTNQIGRAHV